MAEISLLEKNFQTVRFSLCRYNTIEEVDYTLDKIKSIVLQENKMQVTITDQTSQGVPVIGCDCKVCKSNDKKRQEI